MLGDDDLREIIKRLTGVQANVTEGLTDEEIKSLIQHVSFHIDCTLFSFVVCFLFVVLCCDIPWFDVTLTSLFWFVGFISFGLNFLHAYRDNRCSNMLNTYKHT